jgi:membrane protein DedA with SNARE-associated domain
MGEYINLLQNGVDAVGLWFVILFLALENIPGLGFIAPGVTVLVLSGFFHENLVNNVWSLYIICGLTIALVDNLWFWLGYYASNRFKWVNKLVLRAPNIQKILLRQPWFGLFGYQFIPYFRMFLPIGLGAYGFSPIKWLFICIISTLFFVSVFLTIGIQGSTLLASLYEIEKITITINRFLVIVSLFYAVFLYYRYLTLKKA